jgi:hypothetical protein
MATGTDILRLAVEAWHGKPAEECTQAEIIDAVQHVEAAIERGLAEQRRVYAERKAGGLIPPPDEASRAAYEVIMIRVATDALQGMSTSMRDALRRIAGDETVRGPGPSLRTYLALDRRGLIADYSRPTRLGRAVLALMGHRAN